MCGGGGGGVHPPTSYAYLHASHRTAPPHLIQAGRLAQLALRLQERKAHSNVVGGGAQEGREVAQGIGAVYAGALQHRQLGLQVSDGGGVGRRRRRRVACTAAFPAPAGFSRTCDVHSSTSRPPAENPISPSISARHSAPPAARSLPPSPSHCMSSTSPLWCTTTPSATQSAAGVSVSRASLPALQAVQDGAAAPRLRCRFIAALTQTRDC